MLVRSSLLIVIPFMFCLNSLSFAASRRSSLPAVNFESIKVSYEKGQLPQLEQRVQTYLAMQPQSPFADEALYFLGQLQFEKKLWPEALRTMSRISKEYPYGDRLPGALLARAMIFKKMNLPMMAEKSLNQVVKKYPGSQESKRALMSLKVMKTEGKPSKRSSQKKVRKKKS